MQLIHDSIVVLVWRWRQYRILVRTILSLLRVAQSMQNVIQVVLQLVDHINSRMVDSATETLEHSPTVKAFGVSTANKSKAMPDEQALACCS